MVKRGKLYKQHMENGYDWRQSEKKTIITVLQ